MEEKHTHDPAWDGSRIRKGHERSQEIQGSDLIEVRMLKRIGERKEGLVCRLDPALAHHYVVMQGLAECVSPKDAERLRKMGGPQTQPGDVTDRSMKHPPRGR